MRMNEVLLYRGDAKSITKFDTAMTSERGLFGQGIYLTDDPEVAADYTLKGSANVVFTDKDAKTQRELIAGYIRKLIDEAIGWETLSKELTKNW